VVGGASVLVALYATFARDYYVEPTTE
jgi:hypothetical protein